MIFEVQCFGQREPIHIQDIHHLSAPFQLALHAFKISKRRKPLGVRSSDHCFDVAGQKEVADSTWSCDMFLLVPDSKVVMAQFCMED